MGRRRAGPCTLYVRTDEVCSETSSVSEWPPPSKAWKTLQVRAKILGCFQPVDQQGCVASTHATADAQRLAACASAAQPTGRQSACVVCLLMAVCATLPFPGRPPPPQRYLKGEREGFRKYPRPGFIVSIDFLSCAASAGAEPKSHLQCRWLVRREETETGGLSSEMRCVVGGSGEKGLFDSTGTGSPARR